MNLLCTQSRLAGEVRIPGSKSHTIRAIAIASLADGESRIRAPLDSGDSRAAVAAYRALGAEMETGADEWRVRGTGGRLRAPEDVINVANSGTTLHIAMGSCALLREGIAVLTGDDQIRRRPSGPLAEALGHLGAEAHSTRGNGRPPFVVQGRLSGGQTSLEALSSQYLTSLLINTPLGDGRSTIHVARLNEQPYVEMTLDWLERQGIALEREDLRVFWVPGGQQYRPVDRAIPGDFSTATFFLGAAALGDNDILLRGLDPHDTQGDRAVVDMVRQMGAHTEVTDQGIRVRARELVGCEFDLNATPDALPTLAVLGAFARGETRLVNVPQARLKETDRIAVMAQELGRLGAQVRELEDGLIVKESHLHAAEVDGHGDHRVVMALAVAGCAIEGTTTVHNAEAMAVTYPGFAEDMRALGANLRVEA